MIKTHTWEEDYIEYRVDEVLYPEGIFVSTGFPPGAEVLTREILRLAEENERLKAGLAEKREADGVDGLILLAVEDERARIRRELLGELALWPQSAPAQALRMRMEATIDIIIPLPEETITGRGEG